MRARVTKCHSGRVFFAQQARKGAGFSTMVHRPRTKFKIARKTKRCPKCGKIVRDLARCKVCHKLLKR